MRDSGHFYADDLAELDERLLARADAVVPMRDIAEGNDDPATIGLRHDVDDNPGSMPTALCMALWEAERGYRSTYYLLHDSHYWGEEMIEAANEMQRLGHEIGIHVNALAEALRRGSWALGTLRVALDWLRLNGLDVVGCVAHGDPMCYVADFVNDEIFVESARPDYGAPDRTLVCGERTVRIEPVTRASLGLTYDASWLSRGDYLSDSGGRWSQPFDDVVARFPGPTQLHVLQHPDWWGAAFPLVPA